MSTNHIPDSSFARIQVLAINRCALIHIFDGFDALACLHGAGIRHMVTARRAD